MQFNGNADGQDLISDITFLLGGVDINRYLIKDRTRSINERQRMIWSSIFSAYGGWLFMDDNSSDTSTGLPYADQTITASQGLYQLPTTALTIIGAEIKYQNATTLFKLKGLTHEEFLSAGGDATFPTPSTPWAYLPQGDVMRLLPAPNYTQAASLRIYFDAEFLIFTSSDTTKIPGFASVFHRMLSVGASLDYAQAKGLKDKIVTLSNLWNDYDNRLRHFYSERYKERVPHRINPGEDLVEEFS